MAKLTVGSLFSGIGGLDLGLERAGMKMLWQVENNEFCQRVLAKHWPDVPCYGDVRECGAHNLEPVDLICGGFPCQSVSCAGEQKGDKDDRWLWPEFCRIVRELRPRWVLGENVPGLLSANAGREFGTVLRDLAAIGYDAEWESIPAAAVGAPHIRDRVFLLAHAVSGGCAPAQSGHNKGTEGGAVSPTAADLCAADVANPRNSRCNPKRSQQPLQGLGAHGETRRNIPDTNEPRLEVGQGEEGLRQFAATVGACHWATEPNVGRVADGVPARVDRLRALGNAVVPQVAEWIGRRIIDHGQATETAVETRRLLGGRRTSHAGQRAGIQ